MTTSAPRWLRLAVESVRTATTVGALTTIVGFGALNVLAEPSSAGPSETANAATGGPLDAVMAENRCSFTGFGKDVIPASALVRTPAGDTEVVSFDQGWAVFTGEAEGELVAVCLGPSSTPDLTHAAASD